jgi:NCS1 family nucleobase:cation symporter-1
MSQAQSLFEIEEKGVERVTASEAHGKPRAVFGLWMAANVEFATLTTGALATGVFGLSSEEAFAAILVANLISASLMGVFSTFGVEYGLPQMILGAQWFGKWGNRVPSLLNFISGFLWFSANTVIGGYALQFFIGAPLLVDVLLLAVVQVAIAFVGHDLIQAAERYFFYFLVLLFAILTIIAVQHCGISIPANAKAMAGVGGVSGAFILTTSILIGYAASWVPYSSDYTRYLHKGGDQSATKRAVAGNAFWGNLISCVWMECLGALIGATVALAKPSDLFTAWMPHWFKVPLIIAILIGTVSANILNIYSATLSGLAIGIKLRQHWMSLLVGGLGTAAALLSAVNFISSYEDFLFLIGYWIMPWIGVLLAAHLTNRIPRAAGFSAGFAAWVATLVLSVPFYDQALYTGPFAKAFPQFGDCTFIVSFILAAVLYMLLTVPGTAALQTRPAGE